MSSQSDCNNNIENTCVQDPNSNFQLRPTFVFPLLFYSDHSLTLALILRFEWSIVGNNNYRSVRVSLTSGWLHNRIYATESQ